MGAVNYGDHHTPNPEHPRTKLVWHCLTIRETRFLTPPMAYPTYLMHHPLQPRRRPTVPPTCPVVDLYASRLRRVRPNIFLAIIYFVEFRTCDIFDLGHVYTYNYLRAYIKLPVRSKLDIFVSFFSQMVKRFELANVKRNKTKRISIMCVWLLMFIGNEYNYFA